MLLYVKTSACVNTSLQPVGFIRIASAAHQQSLLVRIQTTLPICLANRGDMVLAHLMTLSTIMYALCATNLCRVM